MKAGGDSRWTVVLPAIAGALVVSILIATMLALSAVLGSMPATGGCGADGTPSAPVPGAPERLRPIFSAAADKYRLGPRGAAILAGLTSVESGFGKNMGPSSAGAIGWTQFMPATWARWGVDANNDGRRDPYNATDAIFSSARYLRASGAPGDWYRALFAYNHADWYVQAVLDRAKELSAGAGSSALKEQTASILVIGDSLEVGTFPELNRLLGGGATGDFKGGRPSRDGVPVLRTMLSGGAFDAVVFDLGTNDGHVSELRRSLASLTRLAGQRQIYVATVNSPWDERAKNELLTSYARRHTNVTLIPWHQVSQHLDLPDGIHGGYPARAKLFAQALGGLASGVTTCGTEISSGAVQRMSGHGRLVRVPGQPGALIDSRILPDVVFLVRTYHLTITAGYSLSPVHKANGEHPLGLAIDVVPGAGGTWDDVDRLAHWAEPAQNAPRPPFRWVGYDGDAHHGRGDHLHLSWNHAPAPSRRPPAAWVEVFTTQEDAA